MNFLEVRMVGPKQVRIALNQIEFVTDREIGMCSGRRFMPVSKEELQHVVDCLEEESE